MLRSHTQARSRSTVFLLCDPFTLTLAFKYLFAQLFVFIFACRKNANFRSPLTVIFPLADYREHSLLVLARARAIDCISLQRERKEKGLIHCDRRWICDAEAVVR